jgi:hypothetical protein
VIEILSRSLKSILKHSLKEMTSSFLLKECAGWGGGGLKKGTSLGQERLLVALTSVPSREEQARSP